MQKVRRNTVSEINGKVEQLYKIGVQNLDILNDDFWYMETMSHVGCDCAGNRLNEDLKERLQLITYCPQG